MVAIDAIFLVVGLGILARVFFDLCVYALPTAAGVYALVAAYYTGAGVIGSVLIGLTTGVLTLSAGQIAFARAISHPSNRPSAVVRSACIPGRISGNLGFF